MIRIPPWHAIPPSTVLLGTLCLLLGALLWVRVDQPLPGAPDAGVTAAPEPARDHVDLPELPAPANLGEYGEVNERPLFIAGRRRPEPAAPEPRLAVEASLPAPDPPRARLTGVVVAEPHRLALVDDLASGTSRRLGEGDQLGGWTVVRIQPRTLTLEQAGQSAEIGLARNDPAAGSAAPRLGAADHGWGDGAAHLPRSESEQEIERILEALNRLPAKGLDLVEEERQRAELEDLLDYHLQRQAP